MTQPSPKPTNWDGFFTARDAADFPEDFLSAEQRDQGVHDRDPFEGWREEEETDETKSADDRLT